MLPPCSSRRSIQSILLIVFFIFVAYASASVRVDRVAFDKIGRDEWLRARVSIRVAENSNSTAKHQRFLDDVRMRFYLSFGDRSEGFSFYSREVEIVSLEKGERYQVDFFLPSSVVKRDRLGTDPFAYLVEFEIAGHPIPFQGTYGSSNMANEQAREAFVTKADAQKSRTSGVFVPSYLTPFYLWSADEASYPAFKRRESSN